MIPKTYSHAAWMLAAVVAVLLGLARPAAAADRMDELQDRFKSRFAEIRRLKDDGKIGETAAGFVEAVKGDDVGGVLDEENTDRRELYALIAKKERVTDDAVAKQNALRNFRNAKPGDWLKGENGRWVQK